MADERRRIRVAVAEGHRAFREALESALERAGCAVASCEDGRALARVLADHEATEAALDALAVDLELAGAEGLDALDVLGVFRARVPLVLTASHVPAGLERAAAARGATLVVDKHERGVEGVVRAVRHLVARHARWSGEWISTGLLVRPRAREA